MNKDITILNNISNTYNFIDQVIITKYELLVIQRKMFQVMVANQEIIVYCYFQITTYCYILFMAAYQLVLEVQFLMTFSLERWIIYG